jgi:hypothetical protein
MIVFDKWSAEVDESDLDSLYKNSNLGITQDHENKSSELIWGRD